MIKLKNKNPANKRKKVLRFGKVNQMVGPGYRCGMCEKTFIQEHDCRIHELQVCIPNKGVRKKENKKSRLGEIAYSPISSNIIHPTNVVKHMKHPDPYNKQVPKAGESFHEQVFGKAVTWPGALRTVHTSLVPRNMSVFQNKNCSGYAARNNES